MEFQESLISFDNEKDTFFIFIGIAQFADIGN